MIVVEQHGFLGGTHDDFVNPHVIILALLHAPPVGLVVRGLNLARAHSLQPSFAVLAVFRAVAVSLAADGYLGTIAVLEHSLAALVVAFRCGVVVDGAGGHDVVLSIARPSAILAEVGRLWGLHCGHKSSNCF